MNIKKIKKITREQIKVYESLVCILNSKQMRLFSKYDNLNNKFIRELIR